MKKIASLFFALYFCANIFAASNPSAVKTESYARKKIQTETEMPEWVKNPYSVYQERFYLTGVGNGTDDNSAEEDAKSDLIKVLNQQILSTESIKTYADSSADISTYTATIDTSSEIKSISGLKIAEKYFSPDSKVYALAVLKRQDVADYYAKRISKNDSAIKEYLSFSKSNAGTLQSCIYAQKALELGKENEYFAYLIDAVNAPFPQDGQLSYGSFVQLSKEITEIKKNVSIKIEVDGDEKNIVKNSFAACFSKLGIFSNDDETSPYVLKAKVTTEKTDSPDTKHVYYNYFLTADLTELKSTRVLDSYSTYGRAGHINEQGAKNKSFLSIAKDVENKYYSKLSEYFNATK